MVLSLRALYVARAGLEQIDRNCWKGGGSSSELRRSEELTAGVEWVEVLGPPGAEEGGQGHLGFGSPLGAGAVPPLILRLITTGRRLRSAALLSAGTSGWVTKTKSSLM